MLKEFQRESSDTPVEVQRLEAGDHLDQPEFHRMYAAMPSKFRAELIQGAVIVPSPLSLDHGRYHLLVTTWLGTYHAATPGTLAADNATVLLPPDSETQPDAILIIEPASGGQSHEEGGYLAAAPELVVEVASSSVSYDLHSKFRLYEQAKVREYVVVVLQRKELRWFALDESSRLVEQAADADGIFHSMVFPGLWLNRQAMLSADAAELLQTLRAGLASAEHAAFVQALQAKRDS
ncbi:MAG TPA: Uma2 family endonuclease [Pirellulales bacterium]|jgi:Uma2 family endonuclease|nr:Uma2 family endonuclease [Pirellulales bacterium]